MNFHATYPANYLKQLICFNGYSSLNFSSEHAVVHWIFPNNKLNFALLFINSSNISVMNVSCLQLTQYLNSVQNVHQLQQYTVEVNEIIWLLYQWIYAANHSMSSAKRPSARKCWSALAYISDSFPALHGAFALTFASQSLFNYLFTYKNILLSLD